MSETKFTPGPLTIKGPSTGIMPDDDGGDYGIYDTDGKVIGEAIGLVDYGDTRPAEANAQLWSAAPDLYAAVNLLLSAIAHTNGARNNIRLMEAVVDANAARAKARGDLARMGK